MQSPANEIDNSLFEDGNKEQVRKTFCKSYEIKYISKYVGIYCRIVFCDLLLSFNLLLVDHEL